MAIGNLFGSFTKEILVGAAGVATGAVLATGYGYRNEIAEKLGEKLGFAAKKAKKPAKKPAKKAKKAPAVRDPVRQAAVRVSPKYSRGQQEQEMEARLDRLLNEAERQLKASAKEIASATKKVKPTRTAQKTHTKLNVRQRA